MPNLFPRAGCFGEHVQRVFLFDYQAIGFDRKPPEGLDLRTFKLNSARVRVELTKRRLHPQIISRHYILLQMVPAKTWLEWGVNLLVPTLRMSI